MNKEEYSEETKRLARIFEKILEDKEGRDIVASIIEYDEQMDSLERQKTHIEYSLRWKAENKLISKFEINNADWMNIKIAIRSEGIRKILQEEKVDKIVS